MVFISGEEKIDMLLKKKKKMIDIYGARIL